MIRTLLVGPKVSILHILYCYGKLHNVLIVYTGRPRTTIYTCTNHCWYDNTAAHHYSVHDPVQDMLQCTCTVLVAGESMKHHDD